MWKTKLAGMGGLVWHKGGCPSRETKNSLKHLGLLPKWSEDTEKLEKENGPQKRAENEFFQLQEADRFSSFWV